MIGNLTAARMKKSMGELLQEVKIVNSRLEELTKSINYLRGFILRGSRKNETKKVNIPFRKR